MTRTPPSPRSSRLAAPLAVAGLALFLLLGTKNEVTLSGNESSRLATAEALVEQGTFSIDNTRLQTVDRVRIGGRFYSDKPLFLPTLLAAAYYPLNRALGWSFADQRAEIVYTLGLATSGLAALGLAALFAHRLRRLRVGSEWAWGAGVAVVLTTWIGSFAVTVNNHVPAALALLAFATVLPGARRRGGATAGGAGLLAGSLFCLDLPTGGVFGLAGALTLARRPPTLGAYLAGAAAPVVLMAALHWAAWGNPLPAYLVPGAFDFPENIHTRAIAGLHRPAHLPTYLFSATFGARGLFSHQPALLLALPLALRRRWWRRRPEGALVAAAAAVAAFYLTRTGDYGGWAYGFRFLVPLVPLLAWWSLRWALTVRSPRRRALLGAALVPGLVSALLGAYNPWPVVFEGSATAPGAIERDLRSPALANALCFSFEHRLPTFDPLARKLGPEWTRSYLAKAFRNLERRDLFERVRAWQPSAPDPQRPSRDL